MGGQQRLRNLLERIEYHLNRKALAHSQRKRIEPIRALILRVLLTYQLKEFDHG